MFKPSIKNFMSYIIKKKWIAQSNSNRLLNFDDICILQDVIHIMLHKPTSWIIKC